jgi:hypothetical protein
MLLVAVNPPVINPSLFSIWSGSTRPAQSSRSVPWRESREVPDWKQIGCGKLAVFFDVSRMGKKEPLSGAVLARQGVGLGF